MTVRVTSRLAAITPEAVARELESFPPRQQRAVLGPTTLVQCHAPSGDLVFHRLPAALFFGYHSEDDILWAEPEKALLDWLYIRRKRRGAFPALDELDLGRLDRARLVEWAGRYSRTVAAALPADKKLR